MVRRYGAAVVVMAFDEKGQADTRRAQGRDLRARLSHPDGAGRLSRPKTSSSIRTSSRSRPASRSTTTTRSTSSKPRARSSAACRACASAAASATCRSRSAATIRCARRCTPCSCTTRSAPAWTWASSTRASSPSTRRSTPELRERVEDVILNRRPDATERLLEIAARFKGEAGRASRTKISHGASWPVVEAPRARAGQGHRRVHRRGHRGGAPRSSTRRSR